jgi:acyl-CoA synthetase (NDP forming)
VLVIYAPGVATHYQRVGAAIRAAGANPRATTTVACLLGQHGPSPLIDGDLRVPQFPFPEEAAAALGRVASYSAWRAQPEGSLLELSASALAQARERVVGWLADDGADERGRRPLDPVEASELLAAAGLHPVTQLLADDLEGAVAAARRVGYPVALKASGLERLNKTEAGGVSLDVHGDEEVRDAYRRMVELLGDAMSPAVVQAMAPEGAELRVGLHRHQVLGDVLTLGPGGAAAERIPGECLRLLPLSDAEAERMIDASALAPVLDEQGPTARPAVVDLLVRLAALAEAVPELASVRLNPVLVVPGSAAITDVRITLQPAVTDTRPPVRRL